MDAVRELLAKQVRELEARNAALVDALEETLEAGIDWYEDACGGNPEKLAWVIKARLALAANAPAPVVEREVSGSLK